MGGREAAKSWKAIFTLYVSTMVFTCKDIVLVGIVRMGRELEGRWLAWPIDFRSIGESLKVGCRRRGTPALETRGLIG